MAASNCESHSDGPEFAIDAARGLLERANDKALRLLGMPQGAALPVALDTAMPALRRLREIEAGAAPAPVEQLKFWCAGRLVRVSAKVSNETMSDGRSRIVVRALNGEGGEASMSERVTHAPDFADAAHVTPAFANDLGEDTEEATAHKQPVARDDGQTLREIARRIRDGHSPSAAAVSETAPASPSSSSANGNGAAAPASIRSPRAADEADRATAPLADNDRHPPPLPRDEPDSRTLARVAHELKTPLSAIVAAAEIMRDQQLGPMGNAKYLGYAGDVYESARHALDVINAMLSGATREARTFQLVDLGEIASNTVSALQPLARSGGLILEANGNEERLEVTGDATAIRQIIYNLVSNALKFTPQGGEVHVVTGYLPTGVPFLVVRDTGQGMSEDDIVRAFYRDGDRMNVRSGGGYGIGLPMVRRLAEMMSATIDVDSEPGKGTVVLVSFSSR